MFKKRIISLALVALVVPTMSLAASGSAPRGSVEALVLLVAGVVALVLLRRRS